MPRKSPSHGVTLGMRRSRAVFTAQVAEFDSSPAPAHALIHTVEMTPSFGGRNTVTEQVPPTSPVSDTERRLHGRIPQPCRFRAGHHRPPRATVIKTRGLRDVIIEQPGGLILVLMDKRTLADQASFIQLYFASARRCGLGECVLTGTTQLRFPGTLAIIVMCMCTCANRGRLQRFPKSRFFHAVPSR